MSVGTFNSGTEFLSDLLKELPAGDVQLPDFQRGWVWDDDHIRSLVAWIARLRRRRSKSTIPLRRSGERMK